MALFNHSTRELTAKIVYYGPGLCGKTTNLKVLHGRLEKAQAGKLLSLSTAQDRTIYFDLLPVELGNIKGYTVRFQLCTVPGQVFYNETRKIVLRGVDGLVFVVDSQWSMLSHNLESFQNLRENLHEESISLESLPLVIQYNKRDLPSALSVEALQDSLNFHSYPFVEAVASEGAGVAETFKLISKLTFVDLLRRLQKGVELPAESAEPGDKKAVTLPPVVPPAPPPALVPPPEPLPVEEKAAEADSGDSAASWAVPSADGIFADLSEEPLESPAVTDTSAGSPEVPAEARAPAAAAEPEAGSSLVGAATATSDAPALEASVPAAAPSIETLRKEVEERRSQRSWGHRIGEPGGSLDEKLNDVLEEARKAAQRAVARRPSPGPGESQDGSTQEISATRIRELELQKLREGLEEFRVEARGSRKELDETLEKLRSDSAEARKALDEALEKLRAESAETKKALEKAIEDVAASVRAEAAEVTKRHEEAISSEASRREEAEKATRERIAALEEELRKLHAALDEAKEETRAKVDSLRSAADDATKRWAAALRKTLQEFGE
jgi:signal recognition particle receptor subunit beta